MERFQQGDETFSGEFGGAGLGLTIIQNLIKTTGGALRTTSTLGEGTCTTLTLPLPLIHDAVRANALTRLPSIDALAGGRPADRPAIRLLLVDDNDGNHFNVVTASDGGSVVTMTLEQDFDLILMDIHMPEMDGIEALEQLRAQDRARRRPPTPVLAYTASVTTAEVRNYASLGFHSCVAKPVEPTALVRAPEAAC